MKFSKHAKVRRAIAMALSCAALLLLMGGLIGCETPSEPPVQTEAPEPTDGEIEITPEVLPAVPTPAA